MIKRVLRNFRYIECDDFAEYLSKMASEGWHFRGWKLGLIFEKGEAEDTVYSVQVFVKGSDMDLKGTVDTEEYVEYCKAAGWEYIDASKKFVVFRRIREDAEEIVTPEERFTDAANAELKASGISLLGSLLLAGMYMKDFLFEDFYYAIFSYSMFGIILVLCVWVLIAFWQVLKVIRWYKVNKKKLLYGEKIVFGIGEKGQKKKNLNYKLCVIAVEVLLILVFALENVLSTVMISVLCIGLFMLCFCFIEYCRPNKVAHVAWFLGISIPIPILFWQFMMVNFVEDDICHDKSKAPLIQEDYREVEVPFEQIQVTESKNIFGSIKNYYITYYEYNENLVDEIWDTIDYTIIEGEYDWIMEYSWQSLTKEMVNPKNIAKEWNATDGYQEYDWDKAFYVRYDNQIFILRYESNLTQDQIDIICDKIGLGQVR